MPSAKIFRQLIIFHLVTSHRIPPLERIVCLVDDVTPLIFQIKHSESGLILFFPKARSSTMKSPLTQARKFVNVFIKYFHAEFNEAWIAKKKLLETEPHPDNLSFYRVSQEERDSFRELHREHSTSIPTDSPCQCTLISKGNKHILTQEIPCDAHKFNCDCGDSIEVFVPKPLCAQETQYDAHSDLAHGYFDHLFASLCSVPSIDQPRNGGCMHANIAKWASNPRILCIINEAYEAMGFPKLVHVSDAQSRILISLCSHCFIAGEINDDIFQSALNEVESSQEISFNQDALRVEDAELFIEWMLIAAAKHIAADDEASLAKLRRNT